MVPGKQPYKMTKPPAEEQQLYFKLLKYGITPYPVSESESILSAGARFS